MKLSNAEISAELSSQSYVIFGVVGLGGLIGPTKEEYDRYRPEGWPFSKAMLGMFGLEKNAEGWRCLLQHFGFVSPSPSDIQIAAMRRKESNPTKPSIPPEDDSYPGLTGQLAQESIVLTPIGDGLVIRTTRSVIQLR